MTNISRINFLRATGMGVAALASSGASIIMQTKEKQIKAIAFDGFPIFDPRAVYKKVVELQPAKGQQVIDRWRIKQFTYQWLRALGSQYKSFLDVSRDALISAVEESGATLSTSEVDAVIGEYDKIEVWDDVLPALQQLRRQNIRLCFLSNMSEEMIAQGIRNAGISDYFNYILSSDRVRTFKPDPRVYQLAIDAYRLKKSEILFVAFAGWDVAGAKWFGYPTYWVNRMNLQLDILDADPDGEGTNLSYLVKFVEMYNG